MSYVNPIWLEGRRRYWQRHDWQRFIRHDAHRFLTPAGIAEEKRAAEAEKAARHEAEAAAAAEHEAFYAEHLELRRQLADVKFELAFRRIFRKYSPDQPHVPAGSSEGGQWTSGDSGPSGDDQQPTRAGGEGADPESDQHVAETEATDLSAARRGGGIPRTLWDLTVRQFVSRYCAGQVNRELPRQFEDITIGDLIELRKGGDAAADKCYKLLNQPRFRK